MPALTVRSFVLVIAVLAGSFAVAGDDPKAAPARRLASIIDRAIQQKLDAEKIATSPRADDAEFLRRVSLDLAGAVPPVEQTIAFLDSTDPDKRARLVDELLASPGYARHMTDIWKDLLIPNTAAAARRKHDPFAKWLNTAFTENRPWNEMARDVLGASGLQDENATVTFYITHESVNEITDRVARVFLGVQIQCAQCHDHPFNDWKQDEYWGLAAFFTKAKSAYTKATGKEQHGLTEMSANPKAKTLLELPPSLKTLPPQFLRGAKPGLAAEAPRLPALAAWVGAKENPYVAKAAVNRAWQQLFGRGFVDPVDDLSDNNEPSHPELLNELARAFADSGYDLKALYRSLCASETYQRTSKPTGNNASDTTLFSHMAVKVQSPFQLHDSMENFFQLANRKLGTPAIHEVPKERGRFVAVFPVEEDATPVEYQAGIPQALYLMNSGNRYRIAKAAGALRTQRGQSTEFIETCFLATLSRRPTEHEMKVCLDFLKKPGDFRTASADLLWALLNSTEYVSNH